MKHTHGGKRKPGPGKRIGRPTKGDQARDRITLTIDPGLLKRLDARAAELDLSRSDAAAAALAAWLDAPLDLDLDNISQALDAFEHQLTNEEKSPESQKSQDKMVNKVKEINAPPSIDRAVMALHERLWHRRKHGNSEEAQRWKWTIRQDAALKEALARMTRNYPHLDQLIRHYCLSIGPDDIKAWAELESEDQRALLWHLVQTGGIEPEDLGEVGKRFSQAKARQPARNMVTWELNRPAPAHLLAPAKALYDRLWTHGAPPPKWESFWQDAASRQILASVRYFAPPLAKLLEAGLLPVSFDEVYALGRLNDSDLIAALEHLATFGSFNEAHTIAEGRFEAAVYQA